MVRTYFRTDGAFVVAKAVRVVDVRFQHKTKSVLQCRGFYYVGRAFGDAKMAGGAMAVEVVKTFRSRG